MLVALFAAAASAGGQEAAPPSQKQANYGKTPDTAIPYRHFQEPHNRHFQEVMAFRGTGRDQLPAAPPDTVRIGFMGPEGSAPDADLGKQMLEGVQLAIEQANAQGGCDGIPLELIIRPDSGLWGATSNAMAAFRYEDDVLAVIGSIDGANTHIALRVALKTKTPMVNTGDTDPTLTETNLPWIIRCIADDRQQGYALAHYIFSKRGINRVVAFRVNDRYGRVGIAEFRDAARRLKHPLGVELRWNRGERDFARQLDRIAETGAEAIVLWGNAADTAAVVREIRRRKMPMPIFGCDRMVSRAFLTQAGEAANGVVAVATYDPTRKDPRLEAFTKAFIARFGHQPEAYAAHAYDGTNILVTAIRKAGLNRVLIRDALFEYTHYDGVTGPIEFDATLNDIGPVFIATVRDGRFIYGEVDFTENAQARRVQEPYRTLAQSPPTVRSLAPAEHGAKSTHRLGCFLPLDATGQSVVRGARMAIAEDAARHPDATPVELLIRDASAAWGQDSTALVDLVFEDEILALIGSTERRGTHLAETLAAKFHFPILTLCDRDPTITGIPLPWIFSVAPAANKIAPDFIIGFRARYGFDPDASAALGYDTGTLVTRWLRSGARDRLALRNGLASDAWNRGATGTFRFDALGNRVDYSMGNWEPD